MLNVLIAFDCLSLLSSATCVSMCSEVWPDRREFGVQGMSLQDEFMALREICFTELPSLSLICVCIAVCRILCRPA